MGSLNQSLHVVLTNRTILFLPCLITQHCDFHRICQKEMLAANIEDADLSNASEGKLWALDQIQGSEISLNAFILHFVAVFRGKIGVAFHFIIDNANCFISYLYKCILNILKFLSPSGDLGISLVWHNLSGPHRLFGLTVEILFKLN